MDITYIPMARGLVPDSEGSISHNALKLPR
jgi:hypothetical protein